jgi:hypothetical protein
LQIQIVPTLFRIIQNNLDNKIFYRYFAAV